MDYSRTGRQPIPTLLDLSKDELLKIIALLPQSERSRVIPQTSKALAGILKQSGALRTISS